MAKFDKFLNKFSFGLIVIFVSSLLSCVPSSYFKSITNENLNEILKKSPKQEDYPNAEAILLNNYSYMEMFEDGTSVVRELSRYKILNERGYDFASQSIGYREGYQEVKIFFANTIKADGSVVRLEEKDIKDFAPYAEVEFYTDIKQKKFTMPAIEPGCIIEYSYEVKNIKPLLPYDIYSLFRCKTRIPIKEDILEVVVPKNKSLKYKMFVTDILPEIDEKDNKKRYIFKSLNQNEIIREPRMPSVYDKETFPQFYAWTLDSWDTISKWYINLVKEQMQVDDELKNFTEALIKDKKTNEEKIKEMFYFVSQKVRYVAVELGPYTHKPHSAVEVFKKKYGDCKDKTTLLLTMLKIASIEGFPTLVPANMEILDEGVPTMNVFNHVIAIIPKGNNEYYYLDATNEVGSFDSIPFGMPIKVFVIDYNGNGKFITTPEAKDDKDYYYSLFTYNIDENGDADLEYNYKYYGKAAEGYRYMFKYTSPEERKKYFEKQGIEVKDLKFSNIDNVEEPFSYTLKGNVKNLAQKVDENIMILSDIVSIDSYRDITTTQDRKFPISFQLSMLSKSKVVYNLPKGYKIKNIPKEYIRDDPYKKGFMKFEFKDNAFETYSETKNYKYKILLSEFENFKSHALEIQKYESNVKSIIFEKK
ncbi:MAG: DUF3857 and transglutaminase domain-containing protein [Candidatus Firestonebacteria bacterium]